MILVDLDLRWLGGQGPTYFQAHGAGAAGVGGEAHAPSASTALVPQGYVPPSRYYERVAVLPSSRNYLATRRRWSACACWCGLPNGNQCTGPLEKRTGTNSVCHPLIIRSFVFVRSLFRSAANKSPKARGCVQRTTSESLLALLFGGVTAVSQDCRHFLASITR